MSGWTPKELLACTAVFATLLVLARLGAPACLGVEGALFLTSLPLAITSLIGTGHTYPAWVYFLVLAAFSLREAFVVVGQEIPCGLCKYTSECDAWGNGTEHGGVCQLWRFERGRCWHVTTDVDWTVLWMSLPPLFGTVLLLLAQMYRFRYAKLKDWLLSRVAVILFVPATYVVCAVYSLRLLTLNSTDLWTPKAVFDVCDMLTALSLFAFEQMIVRCANLVSREGLSPVSPTRAKPEHLQRLWELGSRLMQLGCYPYVLLTFSVNMAEIIMKEGVDFYRPNLCPRLTPSLVNFFFPSLVDFRIDPPHEFTGFEEHAGSYACKAAWDAFMPSRTLMNFLVVSLAVICIFMYEQALGGALESIKPKAKFWAVKGLLLVTFWQNVLLFFFFPEDEWRQARMNSFLLVWESFVLGVFQYCNFQPDDFRHLASYEKQPVEFFGSARQKLRQMRTLDLITSFTNSRRPSGSLNIPLVKESARESEQSRTSTKNTFDPDLVYPAGDDIAPDRSCCKMQ